MKKVLIGVLVLTVLGLVFFGLDWRSRQKLIRKTVEEIQLVKKEKPLEKYTFDNLAKTKFAGSTISLGEMVKDETDFKSVIFYFAVDGHKVSGLMNIPNKEGDYPVVVMFRGYVDREKYATGVGTQRAGEFLAKNGFVTLAPDFLGYGQSDDPSANVMEERFQTYVTALTLLESVKNLNDALSNSDFLARVDVDKVGIWGHSNGGQIALSVLEISGGNYPTVLWAPVSKPFPYSILYYTDDFDDHGKALRKAVAKFEDDYDVELYSLTNYLDKINAPLQIHQGDADEAVPIKWSDQLVEKLKGLHKDVVYFKYPGADHNLIDGWSTAIAKSAQFFRRKFEK